jgi:hypothetical protein
LVFPCGNPRYPDSIDGVSIYIQNEHEHEHEKAAEGRRRVLKRTITCRFKISVLVSEGDGVTKQCSDWTFGEREPNDRGWHRMLRPEAVAPEILQHGALVLKLELIPL